MCIPDVEKIEPEVTFVDTQPMFGHIVNEGDFAAFQFWMVTHGKQNFMLAAQIVQVIA